MQYFCTFFLLCSNLLHNEIFQVFFWYDLTGVIKMNEDKAYKLEVLLKIKKALSAQYNSVEDANMYHECMELLLDFEEIILKSEEL